MVSVTFWTYCDQNPPNHTGSIQETQYSKRKQSGDLESVVCSVWSALVTLKSVLSSRLQGPHFNNPVAHNDREHEEQQDLSSSYFSSGKQWRYQRGCGGNKSVSSVFDVTPLSYTHRLEILASVNQKHSVCTLDLFELPMLARQEFKQSNHIHHSKVD